MNASRAVGLTAILVTAIGAAYPLAASSGAGSLTGVVVDDQRRPVAAARVGLLGPAGVTVRSTLTKQDGGFTFDGIAPGRYTLGVMKIGYESILFGQKRARGEGVAIPIRAEETTVTIVAPRGGTISGLVRDAMGRPVPGSVVRAIRVDGGPGQSNPNTMQRANSIGEYRLWGLSPGQWVIAASFDVSSSHEFAVEESEGRHRTMILAPVYFPGVSGQEMAQPVSVRAGQRATGIDVTIKPVAAGRIEGVINATPDTTLEHSSVRILGHSDVLRYTSPAQVDREGRFQFRGIEAGLHTLVYQALSFDRSALERSVMHWAAAEVLVTADEIATVTLTPREGARLSGRTEFAGPAAPADRDRFPFEIETIDGPFVGVSTSGYGERRDGPRFWFTGLAPGRTSIRARWPPEGWWLAAALAADRDILDFPIELRPGDVVEDLRVVFSSQQTGVAGVVTTSDGVPAWDHEVVVFPIDRSYWRPGARRIRIAQPDLDGRFEVTALPPGEYALALNRSPDLDVLSHPARLDTLVVSAARISVSAGSIVQQTLTVR